MDATTIIVALLSLAGTLAGSFFAQRKSSALIAYRLEELEHKVQAHNNLVERMYRVEERTELQEEKWQITGLMIWRKRGTEMNMEFLIQYMTYILAAIGGLAFLVAVVVQVIKELPWLQQTQTSVVALAVSMILCPLAVVIACQYFKIVIVWYYVFASFIAAFVVYLVATGGWDRIASIWERTKYNRK